MGSFIRNIDEDNEKFLRAVKQRIKAFCCVDNECGYSRLGKGVQIAGSLVIRVVRECDVNDK